MVHALHFDEFVSRMNKYQNINKSLLCRKVLLKPTGVVFQDKIYIYYYHIPLILCLCIIPETWKLQEENKLHSDEDVTRKRLCNQRQGSYKKKIQCTVTRMLQEKDCTG